MDLVATVDFPPANAADAVKPAHFVLRGRRILWILEVVRCVPVEVEDGGGMMTACAVDRNGQINVQLFKSRERHVTRYRRPHWRVQ